MSFFSGEYECKIDAKGRMTLPSKVKSKFPEVSGNQMVLSLGMEPCLILYPLVEFRKIYSRVASMNEFDDEPRMFQRTFSRRISEVDLDSAGRILIPKSMLKFASLEKEVTMVGMGNRMELWSPDVFEEYIINDNAEFKKLAQKHLID